VTCKIKRQGREKFNSSLHRTLSGRAVRAPRPHHGRSRKAAPGPPRPSKMSPLDGIMERATSRVAGEIHDELRSCGVGRAVGGRSAHRCCGCAYTAPRHLRPAQGGMGQSRRRLQRLWMPASWQQRAAAGTSEDGQAQASTPAPPPQSMSSPQGSSARPATASFPSSTTAATGVSRPSAGLCFDFAFACLWGLRLGPVGGRVCVCVLCDMPRMTITLRG
jgi:hypothetical protein